MIKNKFEYIFRYWPRFTDEIFKIHRANKGKPTNYLLKDMKDEEILGRVYEPELSKTRLDKDTTYRIEKILGKRKRKGKEEILVKFIGYPDPEWIQQGDIIA